MRKYKWYREWRGGIWYYYREIFDMGRSVVFRWTRDKISGDPYDGGFLGNIILIEIEDYTRNDKIKQILK